MKFLFIHVLMDWIGYVLSDGPDFYVNKNLGYARSNTPSTKLVVGTFVPVRYNLRFQNSLISEQEIVSDIGERVVSCDTESLTLAITKINDLLAHKFETIFKELEEEMKSRSNRAVPLWAVQAGVSVAVPLLTKAGSNILDWVFGKKREKQVSRSQLEREQALATKWIKESTLELCALSADMRKARINDIGASLLRKLERELKLSLVDLASDDLPSRHIINACMTVNAMLTSGECISLIKESKSKVTYRIENVELVSENEGVVSLVLQIPIVSQRLRGYSFINIGKPHVDTNGDRWILKAQIPDMQLLTGEFVKFYSSSSEEQVIALDQVQFDFPFDEDCLKDGNGNDGTCDVISKRVFADVSLQRLANFQLMASFTPCYVRDCLSESGTTILESGVHAIILEGKLVQCGQSTFDLCQEPLFEEVVWQADNYTVAINYIHARSNEIDISLFDEDNYLQRQTIGPVSLRVTLISLISISFLSLLVVLYLIWRKFVRIRYEHALGAIRAY